MYPSRSLPISLRPAVISTGLNSPFSTLFIDSRSLWIGTVIIREMSKRPKSTASPFTRMMRIVTRLRMRVSVESASKGMAPTIRQPYVFLSREDTMNRWDPAGTMAAAPSRPRDVRSSSFVFESINSLKSTTVAPSWSRIAISIL